MRTFNHVGIVTTESKEGAVYNESLSVWLTDYSKSPNQWPYRLYGSLFGKRVGR